MAPTRRAYTNLDALRSLAVLLVLVSHLVIGLGYKDNNVLTSWGGIIPLGHAGVLLFFIHTSLVLMMSLRRLENEQTEWLFARFYMRRLFRIYPLSIVTVLIVLAARVPSDVLAQYREPSAVAIWTNLTLTQNIWQTGSVTAPLWSLPFEVQMYIFLPFLYLLGKRWPNPLGLVALGLAVWFVDKRVGDAFPIYPALLQYAPWFFMGIAAFFSWPARSSIPGPWFVLALFSMTGWYLLAPQLLPAKITGWGQWGGGIVFALLLPKFNDLENPQVGRILHEIAKYSYGIYLSHSPVIWFAFVFLAGQPLAVRVAVLIVLLVAVPIACYHLIEQPFINLGSRVAAEFRRKSVVLA